MENNRYLKGIFFFLLLIFSQALFAAPTNGNHVIFSPQEANQTLDNLSIKLSTEDLNVQHLQEAVSLLTNLQNQAKKCVDTAQEDLDKVDKLWQETKPDTATSPEELTSVQKYLKDKIDEMTKRKSECRLFVLRSDEAIKAFSGTANQLSAKELLKVQPNFFTKIVSSTKVTKQIVEQFNSSLFISESGYQVLSTPLPLILLGTLLILGLLISIKAIRSLSKYIRDAIVDSFSDFFNYVLACVTKRYIVIFVIALILAAVTTSMSLNVGKITSLMLLTYSLLLYIVSLVIIQFFFYPYHNDQSISGIPANIGKPLAFRLKILALISFISIVTYLIFKSQVLPSSVIDLARTMFITLISISLISILWLINRIPKLLEQHRLFRVLISILLTFGLLAILAAEWLGYQQLVTFILKGIFLSLGFGFLAWLLHRIFIGSLQSFLVSASTLPEKIRQQLGMKRYKSIPEIIWLEIIIYLVIWGIFVLIMLKVWGLPEADLRLLSSSFTDGFKIAGLTIIPAHILSAIIFFIVIALFIRWVRHLIENRTGPHIETGSQQALGAIVSYVGIAATLIITLLIAGVNFAGLAIIAGALSVGIGFGLQNIVNNFVSGLVLLIERPIKPGDRVIIGDTEGFVKKISIRSTQIKTLEYSDLIVPNSEIISQKVTNLMFRDFYGRVVVSVGVSYDSDTELVKNVLLKVAANHPEIVNDDNINKPLVLFKDFGDHALLFGMYCIIRNVNLRYIVSSELNFAVEKAFRENNITIAYPQQDIHVKDLPKNDLEPPLKNNNKKTKGGKK